jgi:hypothetical protein
MLSEFIYEATPGRGRLGVGMWSWSTPPCQAAADRLAPGDRAPSRAGAER